MASGWAGTSGASSERRGRGAGLEPRSRFESLHLEVLPGEGSGVRGPPTTVSDDTSRTLINPVDSPDLTFRWSINPYRGCEHGCSYCYARPTHEYLGLSSGLDFESKLFAKRDASTLLTRELSQRSWRGDPIMLSGVTDAYQPIEREFRITRSILEIMAECRQPVGIVTKSHLVTRDADCLAELARHEAAAVSVSLTTLNRTLASKMEPRAASPQRRLQAIETLRQAGVPTGVMIAPVIPGLTDEELPALLEAAAKAGAQWAIYVMLRLPWSVEDVFTDWLEREFPDRSQRVLSRVRSIRDGRLYDSRPRLRFTGTGEIADQIRQVFRLFASRLDLGARPPALSSENFRPPQAHNQMELFG